MSGFNLPPGVETYMIPGNEPLEVCPKCKKRALETIGRSGEDDHGQIEGEVSYCHQCGYEDEWASRC